MPRTHSATMYRSRFRSKSAPYNPNEIRSTMYTNRMNHNVIDRMLDTAKRNYLQSIQSTYLTNLTLLQSLDAELVALEQQTQLMNYFTHKHQLEQRRAAIAKQLRVHSTGRDTRHWDRMTNALYHKNTDHIGRLVLCTRILGRQTEKFLIDQNRCVHCNVLYTFDNVTNVHVCQTCGRTVDVLFINEDTMSETQYVADMQMTGTSVSKSTEYNYVRSPLYRRYLSQFGEDLPGIPLEVMRVLYKYLSNIHLQNSIRCRPTPVTNILRTHGFTKWAACAMRITKMFNGEPIPMLSLTLIDRLVERFELIFTVATAQKHKLPSFEFITHILLYLEGHADLAQSFVLHKTRVVLRRIAADLYTLIDTVKTSTTQNLVWENLPCF